MRIYFDTEFYENGRTIELISIALVREDGARYVAETTQAETLARMDPWLDANVLPHLRGGDTVKYREAIAREIVTFVGLDPEFWAYYADYDWVVLCQLYGRMIDLPKGWPMFCRDVQQIAVDRPDVKLPENKGEHDAMADALWCREAWRLLAAEPAEVDKLRAKIAKLEDTILELENTIVEMGEAEDMREADD